MRILVADDQPIVRKGICSLLKSREDLEVCADAADGQEAFLRAVESKPDLAVLDVNMPVLDGFRTARKIKSALPDTKILMVSIDDGPEYHRVSKFVGAEGFLTKAQAASSLLEAVDTVRDGKKFFKPAPRHLSCIVEG